MPIYKTKVEKTKDNKIWYFMVSYVDALGNQKRYKNKIHSLVLSIMNYAQVNYNIINNVPKNVGRFVNAYEEKEEMDFYTFDEFNKFISVIDDNMFNAFFTTLYFCGLRKGEILALTWKDIDFNKKVITINKSLNSKIKGMKYQITPPKTSSSNRKLPMVDRVFLALEKLYKQYSIIDGFNDNCFVFGCFNPIPNTTLNRTKNKYCEKANLRQIRIHDFRHSCASLLINNEANPILVAKYLGHTDVSMTLNRYSHLYKSKLDEIIQIIDKM